MQVLEPAKEQPSIPVQKLSSGVIVRSMLQVAKEEPESAAAKRDMMIEAVNPARLLSACREQLIKKILKIQKPM